MPTPSRYRHEVNLGPYLGHHLTEIQIPPHRLPISDQLRREGRHERRFQVSEPASVFSPAVGEGVPIQVKILDVSKSGLGMMSGQMLPCGIAIQIVFEHVFVLGEVRYCVPKGEEFHAGILVKDVLRIDKK